MSAGAIVGIVIGALVLIILIWGICIYNKFIRMKNDIEEAFSNMDVYLKKRYDLIPNLVETVKGYAKHEGETLTAVMKARNSVVAAGTTAEKVERENVLTSTLRSLYKVTESYPDLKADKHFKELMSELSRIEEEIAHSRKFYNANVADFNTRLATFPSVIIAKMFKFTRRPLFEVEDPIERKNVKVQF